MKFLTAILFVISFAVYGHGEHRPGPHGGIIRMPGAFHTELVVEGSKEFKIYLLDTNFKFPVTGNSLVKAKFIADKTYEASCRAEDDFFSCHFDKEVLASKGELQIISKRNGVKGAVAKYPFPLSRKH